MPDKVTPGPLDGSEKLLEAVSVHTRKIYDSCRDKDCIEDLRFYPMQEYAEVISVILLQKGLGIGKTVLINNLGICDK